MALEIERKFLLGATVPIQQWHKVIPIEQGYLSDTGAREIRLRKAGRNYWMTIKSKGNVARAEWEIRLSQAEYLALWPETKGSRISKVRHVLRHQRQRFEVDIYGDQLNGLRVVEVEFASQSAARQFEVPDWFGPELSYDPRFKNKALANNSINPQQLTFIASAQGKMSVGVLPFLRIPGGFKLVVISTRRRDRWIFPKGQPELGMSLEEVALMEAHEEAGLAGVLTGHPILIPYQRETGPWNLLLYPMEVTKVANNWIESGQRDRQVLTPEETLKLGTQEVIATGVEVLRDRLGIYSSI